MKRLIDYIFSSVDRFKMPSDSKKREQARKKEAQKSRSKKITPVTSSKDEEKIANGTTNGTATNGAPVELTEDGKQSHTKTSLNRKLTFFFLVLYHE